VKPVFVESPTGPVEVRPHETQIAYKADPSVIVTVTGFIPGIDGGIMITPKIDGLKKWNIDAFKLAVPPMEEIVSAMFAAEASADDYDAQAIKAQGEANAIRGQIEALRKTMNELESDARIATDLANEQREKVQAEKDRLKRFYAKKA
jgi:hypothetical protein